MKKSIVKLLYLLEGIFLKNSNYCPYCAKSDFEVIFKKKNIIDICHCRNCGLYWTNPIFKFPKLYDYLYEAEGLTTKVVGSGELEKLLKSSFKDSGKYFIPILKLIKKNSRGDKFLEYGSSWGYLLYQANQIGFKSTGIEVSESRRRFGKKYLNVNIERSIDELISRGETFDVIFTAHTLEHIGYEIRGIFNKFHKLLNKDGIIIIEVPKINFDKGRDAFLVMGAIHPLGFTEEFFLKNLPSIGFKITIYDSYKYFVSDFDGEGDILIILCRK